MERARPTQTGNVLDDIPQAQVHRRGFSCRECDAATVLAPTPIPYAQPHRPISAWALGERQQVQTSLLHACLFPHARVRRDHGDGDENDAVPHACRDGDGGGERVNDRGWEYARRHACDRAACDGLACGGVRVFDSYPCGGHVR